MKMKGTALAILMSLAMVFAMMPMMAGAAYADSEVVDAGIKYTLHDNGEATVSGHTDALQDSVIIPDNIKSGNVDYAVTSIGDRDPKHHDSRKRDDHRRTSISEIRAYKHHDPGKRDEHRRLCIL